MASCPRGDRATSAALGRWRARGCRRPLGSGVYRCRRDHLGAWRLSGVDDDGGRGAFGGREEDGHAGLPGTKNANQVPSSALLMTTLLIQAVLVATLFSDDAFTFALSLCSHLSLIPYFLSAAFALMLVLSQGDLREEPTRPRQGHHHRGPGDDLHDIPAVRRRDQVPAARLHHLRPRHHPVLHHPERAGQTALHAGRVGLVRGRGHRLRCRHPWLWLPATSPFSHPITKRSHQWRILQPSAFTQR